jgi:hypothetical protein
MHALRVPVGNLSVHEVCMEGAFQGTSLQVRLPRAPACQQEFAKREERPCLVSSSSSAIGYNGLRKPCSRQGE